MEENGHFALEKSHERRILSWSPDPEEEFDDDPQPAQPLVDEVQQQAQVAAARQAEPAPRPWPIDEPLPSPIEAPAREPVEPAPELVVPAPPKPTLPGHPPQSAAGQEPRRRGRPRGRPRRQVHFHVDPDEELLLLAAARKHGSQQKGLVAALQALQDIEVLRDEIERLRAECERQRVLLADAEAIFRR